MMAELPVQFDLALARRLAIFSARAYNPSRSPSDIRWGERTREPSAVADRDPDLSGLPSAGVSRYIKTHPTILYDPLTDAQVLVEDIGDAIVLAFRGTKYARDWLIDCDFLLTEISPSVFRTSRATRASTIQLPTNSRTHPTGSSLSPQRGEGLRVRGENYASASISQSDLPTSAPSAPHLKIHRGFLRAIESLLPKIMAWLDGPKAGSAPKPLLITGHSLGGALATLAAFFLYQQGYPIRAVYTFASPRVGNGGFRDSYNSSLREKAFRVIAAGDLVPLVPGLLDGYRHVGQEVFLRPSEGGALRRPEIVIGSREARPSEIRINPNHAWEILCDEMRATRALRRFNLDFILKFHSLEEDYLPLLSDSPLGICNSKL